MVKCKLDGSNNSGSKPKEEDENATLSSKGKQAQWRRKKDVSKIKCFRCVEMGHYATLCSLRKRDKDEKNDPKAAPAKIEEEFAMIAMIPPGGRWADLEL